MENTNLYYCEISWKIFLKQLLFFLEGSMKREFIEIKLNRYTGGFPKDDYVGTKRLALATYDTLIWPHRMSFIEEGTEKVYKAQITGGVPEGFPIMLEVSDEK